MFRLPEVARTGLLQEGVSVNWVMHLFTNDVLDGLTPGEVGLLDSSDFVDASFPGYSSVTLASASWVFTDGDPSMGVYPAQTFTRSSTGAAELVYGYYFTRATGGAMRGFRQWSAPKTLEFADEALTITPSMFLTDTQGDLMHVGTSVDFRGGTAPDGWLLEDGAAVSRTTYSDLFNVIGTTYGSGDGSTTFNLPDSRGRFRLGKAVSGTGSSLGEAGGSLDHTHGLDGADAHARIFQSGPNTSSERLGGLPSYTVNVQYPASGGVAVSAAVTNGSRLGGNSEASNPAYLAATSIIKH